MGKENIPVSKRNIKGKFDPKPSNWGTCNLTSE